MKLLFDIYDIQIMDGDLTATIRENINVLGPFHTVGVPGRHEIDGTQEIHYPALMEALVDLKHPGCVAHEFVPKGESSDLIAAGRGHV